jgi:hypothetical protein
MHKTYTLGDNHRQHTWQHRNRWAGRWGKKNDPSVNGAIQRVGEGKSSLSSSMLCFIPLYIALDRFVCLTTT